MRLSHSRLASFVLDNSLLLVAGTVAAVVWAIGILLFSAIARLFGGRLPAGLRIADVLVLGVVVSIGFTVSLFFATAAFSEGSALAETKMGALLSFAAAPLAWVIASALRIGGPTLSHARTLVAP